MFLRLSMDALWNHISWPPEEDKALTMTEWGPFFLTGTNAPFISTFIRTADRALHHAANVWRQLADNVTHVERGVMQFKKNDPCFQAHNEMSFSTGDRVSKYEIEAFLGAVAGLVENNLIGSTRNNRLGKSAGLGEGFIAILRELAEKFKQNGVEKKWRDVRNSAYHLNPEMRDWGHAASVRVRGGQYVVELQGVHYVKGASPDLIEVFTETFVEFIGFVSTVRDLLLAFAFRFIAVPTNNHYYQALDRFGNFLVGLGPDGFDFRHFPETATDFVGPLRKS
jgi:hypothetical protein